MTTSRRKFFRGCLAVAGTATLGSLGFNALSLKPASLEGIIIENPKDQDNDTTAPRYVELERSGELERRERELWAMLERCRLCPRQCRVNRAVGRRGTCGTAQNFKVASFRSERCKL